LAHIAGLGALLALSPAAALAQNGTVAFSAVVARHAPLTVVSFANEALLPLAGLRGEVTIRDAQGLAVVHSLVSFRGRHARVALAGDSSRRFTVCDDAICRDYAVIRADMAD
jgi:hypothetical protein